MQTAIICTCFLVSAAVPHVGTPAGGNAKTGNLSGVHLIITTIHDINGMDMGYDRPSPDLYPWQQWTGFFVDMIDWVAERAEFTYELRPPSGRGSACILGEGMTDSPKAYATQFSAEPRVRSSDPQASDCLLPM